MQSLKNIINRIFEHAISEMYSVQSDAVLQHASRPEYGDYQANFALKLAKILKKKPQEIAREVLETIKAEKCFSQLEVSGPGFINITIDDSFLADKLDKLIEDERLGVEKAVAREIVVIDYSSPNIAKEMHVGHLRSTIIGDAIARILLFLGHEVIPQSHLGDWGTQFGMLIAYMIQTPQTQEQTALQDLNEFYQKAKQKFDEDAAFAQTAREYVVKLQSGDEETLNIWRKIVAQSEVYFQKTYDRLNTLLEKKYNRGESFYNPMLKKLATELLQNNIAELSEGAAVIFLEGFVDKNQNPLPLLIQKSDGGYLYATTDLAALKYRIEELNADKIIYVTDARQQQHFSMLFQAAKKAQWVKEQVTLQHVMFGAVLGKDKKPFKTRSGATIKLVDLLDEAEHRALMIIDEKNPSLPETEKKSIAKAIGIGAVKYADLASDRLRDYIFDWDLMLAFEGNTAPYLQNAYVRIASLFRKGDVLLEQKIHANITIESKAEHVLAVKLLEFGEVIDTTAHSAKLHILCQYLFELASRFHQFYEQCPILTADEKIKFSRLKLAQGTAKTLKLGLNLLGIDVIERM